MRGREKANGEQGRTGLAASISYAEPFGDEIDIKGGKA